MKKSFLVFLLPLLSTTSFVLAMDDDAATSSDHATHSTSSRLKTPEDKVRATAIAQHVMPLLPTEMNAEVRGFIISTAFNLEPGAITARAAAIEAHLVPLLPADMDAETRKFICIYAFMRDPAEIEVRAAEIVGMYTADPLAL